MSSRQYDTRAGGAPLPPAAAADEGAAADDDADAADAGPCAVRTSMGKPVLFFDQISAIFAPRPNLPRVCRTPYLDPASTRPSMSGMASCGMPHPLSRHVTR